MVGTKVLGSQSIALPAAILGTPVALTHHLDPVNLNEMFSLTFSL